MKPFHFSAALLALALPSLAAPSIPAGLLYQPPPGWRLTTVPGLKYKVSFTHPANGFATNLNIVDETAPMSIEEYARQNIVTMKRRLPGFQLTGQSPFATAAGLRGVRLRGKSSPGGRALRQVFYLFPGRGSQKFVVTLSSPAADGSKYDQSVDAAMKTFTVK